MQAFPRITNDPAVMSGKPCIRGMRLTVGVIVNHIAGGYSAEQLLADYPYLQAEDIQQALAYAAWRLDEQEYDLQAA
jgi:uncharacterized protein (DUF433 family)